VAKEVFPSDVNYYQVKKTNKNGIDEVEFVVDTDKMIKDAEGYAVSVLSKSSPEAEKMFYQLEHNGVVEAGKLGIRPLEEKQAFVSDYIKTHAIQQGKLWVDAAKKKEEMANLSIDKTGLRNTTNNFYYGNQQELPRKTQGNEEIIIDTKNAELANQNHDVYLQQKGFADEALKNADKIKVVYGEKSKEYAEAMTTANGFLTAQKKAREAQFAYEANSKLKGGKKINVNPTATKTLNLTVKDDNGNDVVKAVDFSELRGIGDKVFIVYNEKKPETKGGENKDEFDTRFQEVTKRNESELDDSQVFGKKGEWRPQVIDYLNKNKSSKTTTPTKKEEPKKVEKPKMTQAEFNAQWANLKKGESLLAPNGVTYKKQ